MVKVRPSPEHEGREAPGHSGGPAGRPAGPSCPRGNCQQLRGECACRGREARAAASRLPSPLCHGAGGAEGVVSAVPARQARPCPVWAGPGPRLCSRLDGGPPAVARPRPLASLGDRPACPEDALRLSDEGRALCVFPSGRDGARVGVLAGAACQSHFQARPDASSPKEKGAASGRLWQAAFDPFPGWGAPRRGEPWGSGPLIPARPAHCEFHGNPYTGLGFQG